MADTQQTIDNLILAIRTAEEPESVTNTMLARILEYLSTASSKNETLDSFMQQYNAHISEYNAVKQAGIMVKEVYCDASGYILRSKLPQQLLLSNDPAIKSKLPSDIVYASSQVGASQILPQLFIQAVNSNQSVWKNGSYGYADVDYKELMTPIGGLRANGYYPDVNASMPYYAYGVWMTPVHVWAMIFDRYTPYGGGTQCQSFCNLPAQPKSSDSRLSLDYAVCNNHRPKALTLGPAGWKESVSPTSMHRAFDNAIELRAIIGEISMDRLANAPYLLFHNCPELWQFHLANIPDIVDTLDLSGCSADICTIHHYTVSESSAGVGKIIGKSSLQYLLENYARNITRTKVLNLVVSGSQYVKAMDILDQVSAAGHDISWITLVTNGTI